MELKPGYKQTEVGVIPDDWNCVHIGDVAETSSGATPSRAKQQEYFDGGTIPWVKTLDLNNSSIHETHECVTPSALEQTSLRMYPMGSVLVAMYGGFNQIGRAGMLTKNATINQALTAIRPDQSKLSSRFLLNYLNFRVEYWKTVASSSRKDPNITGRDVREFPIALPPLKEQEAAGEALQDIEEQILMFEGLIAKKNHMKQAAMQELLTGKRRLPGFEGEWEVRKLGDIFLISAGKSKSSFVVSGGDYWVVDMGSVSTEGQLMVSKQTNFCGDFLENGDLIMPKDDIGGGNIIGKVGFIDASNKYVLGDHVYCLRAKEGDPQFLAYMINSHLINRALRKKVIGSAQLGLGRRSVTDQEIPFPDPVEQAAIAASLSEMDAQLMALHRRVAKTRALKKGMMQQLLTGKIRLP